MAAFLFPNFLNDLTEYRQAETLWRDSWDNLVRRVGQEGQWATPWLTTVFADGTPFADGNPVFSAIAVGRRLGVRVIQLERAEGSPELSCWTDTFAEGESEAIEELVIACALTPQTLADCLALMERWLNKGEVGSTEASAWGRPADANDFEAPHGVA